MSASSPRYTFVQILEGIEGVLIILLCYLTFFLKGIRNRWGMSKAEVALRYPVDECVTEPKSTFTHGIIIHAPTTDVWPWIAQIGQGKGGFYSYEALENISGLHIYNADHVLPQFQNPQLGDLVAFGPRDAYPIVYCEQPKGMAIENWFDLDLKKTFDPTGITPRNVLHLSWLWYVEMIDEKTSRFVSRNRVTYTSSAKTNFIFKVLMEPIVFAMDRKMCLGIKKRAEQLANTRMHIAV